jgi:PAS domain S-box-containing protein
MALSKKTKTELIAEIKKIQRKIQLLEKEKPSAKKQSSPKEKSWTSVFKHSANTVAIVDKQLTIVDLNKKKFRKKVIGTQAFDSATGKYKNVVKKNILTVFKTTKPQEYTVEAALPNGQIMHVSCRATPIIKNGIAVYVVVEATDITKEIEAKKLLKQSEEKYKKLSDAAFEAIVVHQAGKVVEVNKATSRIFNYSEKEIIGQSIFKFIDEDYHQFAIHKLKNKDESPYEMLMLRKGKVPFWAKLIAREILYKGVPARVVAIRDININKENERKIKESEERFRILSNATFEGIVFSENGKIIDANDQFLKMYGYRSVSELIGKNIITDFIVPKQHTEAKRLIRLPTSELFEVDTFKKDKSIISVISKGQNIPYFGRSIRATVVYNISERKQYEERLRESERVLSTLMNNLPGMAYRCDYDDKWTMRFISNGFLELTGYSPKDFINNKKRSFSKIIHPEDRHIGIEQIKSAIKTKTPFEIEYRIITKDGEEKWVWEKGEGIFSEEGALLFLEGFITDVNAKKQYELELTQSRETYKSLIDHSPDGVVIHIDGVAKFANPIALNILGLDSITELKHVSIFELVMPQYRSQVSERMTKIKSGEKLDFFEIKLKNKKGELKELETKPILIKYNGVEAIQVVFHDLSSQKQLFKEQLRSQIAEETNQKLQQEITERKNTERILRSAEKYTRLLIDSSLNIICATDINGYINEFNKAALKTFGYELHEVVGKHIDILYVSTAYREQTVSKELYAKGNFSGEIKNIKKNGEVFDAYLSASVLKNDEGEMIGVIAVAHDISESKKSEEQMRTQTAKLNAIIENSNHIIWSSDRNYCLTSFNHNFINLIKVIYNIDSYMGMSLVTGNILSTNEYNNFWIQKYNNVLEGIPQYFETQLVDKSGNTIWCEMYLNPIFDENKKVVEISGIGLDITDKKEVNEKLRQSVEEKDVLLKEVHHRVKNNLQVISSILNLQSSYVKDQQTLNILKESQNRIKSMAFIHESLYQTKDLSSINFSEYVSSLSHNLIHSYSNINHEIKLSLDIQLIFLNLDLAIPCGLIINEIVSNSLKYAFIDDHKDAVVTINMKTEGDNIRLIIGDNGIGLPQHINYKNTESLGLQLVVTLVDQLNGTIDIDTKNGTFYAIEFKQTQIKNRI